VRTLFSARTLVVLSGLFILYATTIPWDFSHGPSLDHVSWNPFWDSHRGRPPSIPDLVQNVVLFVPFGFFAALAYPSLQRRAQLASIVLVGLAGLSLSLFVEGLQTMSYERSPAASDLATNFAGTLVGAAIAFAYSDRFSTRLEAWLTDLVRERPGLLLYLAAVAAVAAGALAPFVPSLDVGNLRANLRQLLDHTWGPKPIGALVGDALAFGAVAFFAVPQAPLFFSRRLGQGRDGGTISRTAAVAAGVITTGALAIALEFAQLVMVGHSPGVQDAVAGIAGALVGASVAAFSEHGPLRPARPLGDFCARAPALAISFAILVPAVRALSPFQLVAPEDTLAAFSLWQLVPFWAFFRNINPGTVANVFEAALHYLPLGYVLVALRQRPALVFACAFALAEVLEVLQIGIAGRTLDITEGIYAGAGALVGAWAFERLRERGTRPHDTWESR
jgi:glycopeptide antibiotics resistance protein